MSQLLRPIADIAADGWTPSSGSDLYPMVNEVSPNDATFIRSPDNPTTQTSELKYGPGTGTHSSCTTRARLEAKGVDTAFYLELFQGSTELDSWTETVTVAEGKVTRTHVSTGISITDPTDLRTRHRASGGVTLDIIVAALGPNSESNHPLPLMGSWAGSTNYDAASGDNFGYTPQWQTTLIAAGRHLLPWFNIPTPDLVSAGNPDWSAWLAYYQTPILYAAAHGLPISFVGTQWEHLLYDDAAYFTLPPEDNPCVVRPSDEAIQSMVSPFGPIEHWESVGATWAVSEMLVQLQTWYPNPPLVIFVSNNEAPRLQWINAEDDQHYLDLYGTGQTDEFKRDKVGEGWIARYSALQQAWRDGMSNANWRANCKFIGYDAFGPRNMGRASGWKEFSLCITDRIDPNPLMWEGGSPAYYLDGNPAKDHVVYCPQVEAMNQVFMQTEAHTLNPEFWFEYSIWNGCETIPSDPDVCAAFIADNPGYSAARYAGMAQFGMWLNRPRLVRDYRNYAALRSTNQGYFDALADAVDRVHSNATLANFWRSGTLVPNTTNHPYQIEIPTEYASEERMFMLTTDLDPAPTWALTTPLDVFVLARVLGTTPSRSWLLYAFSPNEDLDGVVVTIPSVGDVTLDATIAGTFWTVAEGSLVATEVV